MECLAGSEITVAYQRTRVALLDQRVEGDQPLDAATDDDHVQLSLGRAAHMRATAMIAAPVTGVEISLRPPARYE